MNQTNRLSDAELRELRAAVRKFLHDNNTDELALKALDRPNDAPFAQDRSLWSKACQDLGLGSIAVAESFGGMGFDRQALGVIAQETGRALYAGPLLASAVLAATILQSLCTVQPDDRVISLIEAVAAGEKTVAFAGPSMADAGSDTWHSVGAAVGNSGQHTVDGYSRHVIDGAAADLILVATNAPESGDCRLLILDPARGGVSRRVLESIDPARGISEILFDRCDADLLAAGRMATGAIADGLAMAQFWIAAESSGLAARALSTSVEYAKQRIQFTRPIGSFQAVAHRCAELLVEVENTRSAVAAVVATDPDDRELFHRTVSAAKVAACESAISVTDEAIHLHGGIGFTWEHPMHLLHRRACLNESLFGTGHQHRNSIFRSLQDAETSRRQSQFSSPG